MATVTRLPVYLRASCAANRYYFWRRLCVCASVCHLSSQNLENYRSEIAGA